MMLVGFLVAASSMAWGQQGPQVPCADCDTRVNSPWPVSGAWSNSDRTGSGFLFEIQNGVLAGYHFGYDSEGDPEWLLFSGTLAASDQSNVLWMLETNTFRFQGGNCIGCPFSPHDDPQATGTIKLEFFQKNHGKFQINNAEPEFIVPLLYGSAGHAYFKSQTPYLFPELATSNDDQTPWVLVFLDSRENITPVKSSLVVHMGRGEFTSSGPTLRYDSLESLPDPSDPLGPQVPTLAIVCDADNPDGLLACVITMIRDEVNTHYQMPVANLAASRFYAEDESGNSIEGFRLGYD